MNLHKVGEGLHAVRNERAVCPQFVPDVVVQELQRDVSSSLSLLQQSEILKVVVRSRSAHLCARFRSAYGVQRSTALGQEVVQR